MIKVERVQLVALALLEAAFVFADELSLEDEILFQITSNKTVND